MANLALADLILPYLFRGENLGPNHAALSALRVVTFETAVDALGVVLRGHCEVNGRLNFNPATATLDVNVDEAAPAHDPSRSHPLFDLADTSVDFELLVARQGSAIVQQGEASFTGQAALTKTLFDDWQSASPSDFPSTGFVLDLIVNAPRLRPPFLHPAKVSDIGVLEPDPAYQEVALTLPRLRFRFAHGNELGSQLVLSFVSAGVSNLDDPGSTSVSEMISMEPPYAYIGGSNSHVVGVGFRSATLDLDGDWTPPALRDKVGVGDDWKGLYFPEARLFVSPDGLRNLAFECGAQELLVGLDKTGGIWGDFEAALVQQGSGDVRLNPRFDANGRSYRVEVNGTDGDVVQARARVPDHSTLVVDVSGGRTPYHRQVKIDGTDQPADHTMYDVDLSAGTATVDIHVTTGSGSATPAKMHIELTRLQSQPRLTVPGQPDVTGQAARITAQSGFSFALDQGSADGVTIRTEPPVSGLMWTPTGGATVGPTATLTTSIAASSTRHYDVSQPGASGTTILNYYFFFDCPGGGGSKEMRTQPATDALHQTWSGGDDPRTVYAEDFEALPDGATIAISGDASFEGDVHKLGYNTKLAWRRAEAVRAHLAERYPSKHFNFDGLKPALANPEAPTDVEMNAWAADVGWTSHVAPNDRQHWRATVTITANTPDHDGSVDIERPAPLSTPTTTTVPPADPPVPETSPPPDWFRSVKAKVRIVDSQLIALQLDLEVDMQTFTEDRLQGHMASLPPGTPPLPRGRTLDHGTPVGPDNPADGITAFRVLVQTDPATGRWDTLLMVGADPADKDGLFHFGWIPQVDPMPADKDVALTLLGSYLSFWPLLAEAPPVDSFRNAADGRDGAVVPAVLSATALAVPGIVAVLPWFAIERVILFGAEYFHTQRNGGFTGTLLVDVEMDWSINLLDIVKIRRDNPLKVRYKAIGLQLTNRDVPPDAPAGTPTPDRWDLLPVFDASRGYTIDVAGGAGGMEIGDPLGRLLRIAGARLSRSNPMTLEVDIALGVDLGVVSVDQASVRAYLDGSAPPELTALSASVDIPGALVGSGYMRIGNAPDGTKTIGGQLDLTLRPVNVRVAAAVEVANIVDSASGRTATGVYVGLNVVLPAGIPLGSTGLGIFGFRGIFGMHYHRTEITGPNASVPALAWLKASKGQPHLLKAPNNGPVLWEPKIDKWAFGIGILIGTMEGGVLINLDGTFLLELPGPRVLIMMNARILSPPPSMDGLGQSGGILAVIEITPEHFLIGVLVSWEIEDLIKIVIPVEAVFPFGANSQDWHIYLGARKDYGPSVEVDVLGIVKGTGYLMFRGSGLNAFNNGHADLPAVRGFGIGIGVGASFSWGDRSSGLYLDIGGGMDAVLGFSPFLLAGNIWVAGELHLWVVSIGADASLTVIIAEQQSGDLSLYIHGRACGHVDLFFFSISGCVDITLAGPQKSAAIPALVDKVSLQSRSPALVQGTGVDKGVDVSLGTAHAAGSYPGDEHVPIVPIDAIPVISFNTPPSPDGTVTIEGLGEPLTPAPGVTSDGTVERSGKRYRYKVTALGLERVKGNGQVDSVTLNGSNAPATWWTINPAEDNSPNAQLALLTYQVTPATKAIEYHDKLVEDVIRHWGAVCDPVAEPAEVLWTFKLEALGPSPAGWELEGVAWPDAPGTKRSTPPDTTVHVSEPWRTGDPGVDGLRGVVPAIVVGGAVECRRKQQPPVIGHIINAGVLSHLSHMGSIHATTSGDTASTPGHVVPPTAPPHVVVGGSGPVLRPTGTPSGAVLSHEDPVHGLVATDATAIPLRISQTFHEKATAALPGLHDLVATGQAVPSLSSRLAQTRQGVELSNVSLLQSLALATHPPSTSVAGEVPGTHVTGPRCPVKVLFSPLADYGKVTNFDDPALADQLARKVKRQVRTNTKYANLVRIESGSFEIMRLLVMVNRKVISQHTLVAAVYDAKGNQLDEIALTAADLLGAGAVLPGRWTDTTGPWADDIDDLVNWSQHASLQPAYLKVPGHAKAAYVELGCMMGERAVSILSQQVYALAAISMIAGSEVERNAWDQTQSSKQEDRLVEAIGPNATNCALLKADSRYRVTVSWFGERLKDDGTSDGTLGSASSPQTNTYWFRTDKIVHDPTDTDSTSLDQPGAKLVFNDTDYDARNDVSAAAPVPVRMDPWVLISLPEDNEQHWFGHEELRLVFSTPDIDRLFGEYGKELRMRIHAANGQHPEGTPSTPMPLPILGDGGALHEVDGVVLSPWHQAVGTMLGTAKPGAASPDDTYASCITFDATSQKHSEVTSDVPLDPFMDYMLDVEIVDSGAAGAARGPLVFRRHFSTGAYGTLKAFAFSITSTLTSARFSEPDTFRTLLSTYGTRPLGSQIDSHLLAHHIDPLPVPDDARVVVFWEQSSGSDPQPAAVLIDATEPLSRSRNYPRLVTDGSTSDNAQRWILAPREWLRLDAGGDAGIVQGIVYAPGLQRAFVVFAPGQRGKHLTLDLVAPGMPDLPFLDQGTRTHRILDITLTGAPWEED